VQAYVEYVLDEIGLHHDLDEALKVLPEGLRRYITVDTAGLARGPSVPRSGEAG
jgi:hypothetical protein